MTPRSPASPSSPERASSGSRSFPEDFERASQGLRGALVELLSAVDADPDHPQRIARRFELNKNLTWKVARIVRAGDAVELAPHVPGSAGLRILLSAFERHGAAAERLEAVRNAADAWDSMVKSHAGDRKGLDLLLASLHPRRVQAERLEAARRLSFEGNGTIWGVQARLRLGVQVMAPNADDPTQVDLASIGGVFGFFRLRPTGRWPLFRIHSYGGAHPFPDDPLDPRARDDSGLPLLLDHCHGELPELRASRFEGETLYELGDGPVGQSAAITCVFGWRDRRFAPVFAESQGEVGEHFLRLDAPVEKAHLDLLIHRDLPFAEPPRLHLHSLMQGPARFPLVLHPESALPCVEEVQVLHGEPPILSTPDVPDLTRIVETAAHSLGCELGEFRAYRLELRYPPIPTILNLYHPLPLRVGP